MARVLTEEKKKLFALEYVNNGRNAANAALSIGYAKTSCKVRGHILMKNPDVVELVDKYTNKALSKREITFDWKVGNLHKIIEDSMTEDSFAHKRTAIQAIAELNKMQGHYSADKHVNANINVTLDTDVKEAKELMDRLIESKRGNNND